MKKLIKVSCIVAILGFLLNGCTVTTYTKEVVVRKDATGNVISIEQKEAVIEPHQGTEKIQSPNNVKFDYLK